MRLARILARAVLAATATALLAGAPASAQVSDMVVKAAFIPKFARYVNWPSAPGGPVAICIIGDDPFGAAIDHAASAQSVDGRPFVVKRVASPTGAVACSIAFISGAHAGEALASLARQPILTITDSRSSSVHGVIHFAIVEGRVRFFIDNAQAQARGLTISSRLLALAIGVNQK
jgi:hypothetical protein